MTERKMILPASREDWLALRHKYVGSTEVGALFGYSNYSTAFQLAVEKKAPLPPQFDPTERAEWGLRLQDAIARGVAEDYGVKIRRLNSVAVVEAERRSASFDAEVVGITEGDVEDPTLREMYRDLGPGILEIKTVDRMIYRDQWKHPEGDEAPTSIELQVQAQLDCIGRSWTAIAALVGGNELKVFVREHDEPVCEAIREKVREFWSLLRAGKMPPIELPADVDILRQIYLSSDPGKVFKADAANATRVEALCGQYLEVKELRDYYEAQRKTYSAQLLMEIGDCGKGALPGYTIQANTVPQTTVPEYVRAAYRNLVVRRRK